MMLRRRPGDELKEPIALRTRSTSSRSGRRYQRELDLTGLSETDSEASEASEASDDSDDVDDVDVDDSFAERRNEVRRSKRSIGPPMRLSFESESTDVASEDTGAREERRDKARLLKLMRRVDPVEDEDEVADYLKTCGVDECREYYERQQQLEGQPAKPLRIQLYDLVPRLTAAAAQSIFERVKQVEDTDPFSSDGAKLSAWARTVMSIPFGVRCPMSTDAGALGRVSQALDAALYGQTAAKDAMLQAAAQMMAAPDGIPQVVVLVGAPGVGKTTLARALGKAMGLPFQQISLGGSGDVQVVKGHSMTYEGSRHGSIVRAIRDAGVLNPVILLDEADKLSDRGGGELGNLLIHMLDDSQRHEFVDDYVDIPVDLSGVLFVLAVNDLELVSPVLRDRLHEVHFDSPDLEAKTEISLRHLLPAALRNCGLDEADVQLTRKDVAHIVSRVQDEPGVRGLGRAIKAAVMRVNVLKRGGAGLNLPYSKVDVSATPVRIDPATFDALTTGNRPRNLRHAHMYM
jgi:MoxR-like ATPase